MFGNQQQHLKDTTHIRILTFFQFHLIIYLRDGLIKGEDHFHVFFNSKCIFQSKSNTYHNNQLRVLKQYKSKTKKK